MKKMHVILLIVVIPIIIGLPFLLKYLIIGKEIEISFANTQKHTKKSLTYNFCWDHDEWLIINSEAQKKNLEAEGLIIPHVDFDKNFIIMSKYKISKLYRKVICNECTGAPDGRVIFDKKNSDSDYYYFYLMPKIKLSQGVG